MTNRCSGPSLLLLINAFFVSPLLLNIEHNKHVILLLNVHVLDDDFSYVLHFHNSRQ